MAGAVAQAVHDVDDRLILYGLAGSALIRAAEQIGLRSAAEVYADRSYQEDGSLTPRSQPGAMITDADTAVQQVLSMVERQEVRTLSGPIIPIQADTLCIHGDGAEALLFVQRIRKVLQEYGVHIVPAGSFIL